MDKLIFTDLTSSDTISIIISSIVFIAFVLVIRHVNKRRKLNAGLNSENEAMNGLVNVGMYFLMFAIVGLTFYVSSSVSKNTNKIILTAEGIEEQRLFSKNSYTWADVNSFVIKMIPETSLHSVTKKRSYQTYSNIVTRNDSSPLCFGLASEVGILLSNRNILNLKTDEIYQTKRGTFSVISSPVVESIAQLRTISKDKVPFQILPFHTSDVEYTSCTQQGFELDTATRDLNSLLKTS